MIIHVQAQFFLYEDMARRFLLMLSCPNIADFADSGSGNYILTISELSLSIH